MSCIYIKEGGKLMLSFFEYIVNSLKYMLDAFISIPLFLLESLCNILVALINFILMTLGYVVEMILSLLPNTPFAKIWEEGVGGIQGWELVGYIDWLVPLDFILGLTGAWVSAIIVYYGLMYVMKIIKLKE